MKLRSSLAFAALALAGAAGPASAQQGAAAPASGLPSVSANACETEVNRTVQRDRAGSSQVQFVGAKRTLAPISDDETGIKGEGRYRSRNGVSTPFTYSCVFNPRTGEASGVMFSEGAGAVPALAPAAATRGTRSGAAAAAADAPIVSTDACETAVAKVLQDKHPRANRIVFGSDTRRLQPAPNARTSMEGDGSVQRAPGMAAVRFSYSCTYDTRNGNVERVQTSE